jgi:hypothetical protein
VTREFVIVDSSETYGSTLNRHLCVDVRILKEMAEYWGIYKDQLTKIQERILTVPYMYFDNYKKEGFNLQTKNVTAIRLFDNENTRFYCKEETSPNGRFLIICGVIFSKKSQKNNKSNKPLIKAISSYVYRERQR